MEGHRNMAGQPLGLLLLEPLIAVILLVGFVAVDIDVVQKIVVEVLNAGLAQLPLNILSLSSKLCTYMECALSSE